MEAEDKKSPALCVGNRSVPPLQSKAPLWSWMKHDGRVRPFDVIWIPRICRKEQLVPEDTPIKMNAIVGLNKSNIEVQQNLRHASKKHRMR